MSRAAWISLALVVLHAPCLADDDWAELQAIERQVREVFTSESGNLEPLFKALTQNYRCEQDRYREFTCTRPSDGAAASVIERVSWRRIAANERSWMSEHLTIQLRPFDLNAPPTMRRELLGAWKQQQLAPLHSTLNCNIAQSLQHLPSEQPAKFRIDAVLRAAGSNCDHGVNAIHFMLRQNWQ